MAALAFVDSETRSELDVTECGAYKYANHDSTDALVWGFALDDDDGGLWSPEWAYHRDFREPTALLEHAAAGGYLVAWNAFFDRWIWNAVMVPRYGWPKTLPEQWLCAQAQAEGNNLPGQLAKACEALGTHYKKDPKGKKLINTLSRAQNPWLDEYERPEWMGHFRSYCRFDVLSMRDVWQCTRPLTESEWREYHASERINDRGAEVDWLFAMAAKKYADAEFSDINGQLADLTGDPRLTLSAHLRKAKWLFDQLEPDEELQDVTRRSDRDAEKPRYSCDRPTREAVLELLLQPEHAELFEPSDRERIIEFLELIEAGNSAAVRKFKAIVNQECGGRVRGQYSFNGAGQTGRFSSRGIQIHNLIRDPVDKSDRNRAIDAIEAILDRQAEPHDLVSEFGYPISRLLARLIRPTFIAPDGRTLVWADYDQIEGRTLPWLANSPQAETKLDIYRAGEDTYKLAACMIFRCQLHEVTDEMRTIGKVAELALGFGGAVGAFAAMGRGYGVIIPEEQAAFIVTKWRDANAWVRDFWDALWGACMQAYQQPGNWFPAGRVQYLYHPQLMRGTMICALPDGRWLVYPRFKHELVEYDELDKDGKPTGRTLTRWRTSFVKGFGSGHGRIDMWYGTLAENVTQATAASALRHALMRAEYFDGLNVVLHTHDEIVCECADHDVAGIKQALEETMLNLPAWADGLPLSATADSGPFYTK